MKVQASFVVVRDFGRSGDYLSVKVQMTAGWDFLKQEPLLSDMRVVSWDGLDFHGEPAPAWRELDGWEQSKAFDAVAEVLDYQALQEEAAGGLPFVLGVAA